MSDVFGEWGWYMLNPFNQPCMRETLIAGVGCAAAAGLHRFRSASAFAPRARALVPSRLSPPPVADRAIVLFDTAAKMFFAASFMGW